jgi:2-keto-4-pentenoate hydratase/2-oxohepta-3-ene-1,7-dioic acid hydratase in catechol pathway
MKWMRFMHGGRAHFGLLQGDSVQPCQGDMFGAADPLGGPLPLAEVQWLPPVQPGQVIGLWNNFRAAATKNGWAEPAEPLYFLKSPTSLLAHGAPIPLPNGYDGRVVYEGELAIVIGRTARNVSVGQAPDHIFGYTAANDVTALELLHRDPSFPQWTRAKSFDGFGPLGPCIATDFSIGEGTLLRTLVGGRERQNYALADMFFPPAELVSRLSQCMTLQPGDVILCGTSLGVLPMRPGTEVQVCIDGLPPLVNLYG